MTTTEPVTLDRIARAWVKAWRERPWLHIATIVLAPLHFWISVPVLVAMWIKTSRDKMKRAPQEAIARFAREGTTPKIERAFDELEVHLRREMEDLANDALARNTLGRLDWLLTHAPPEIPYYEDRYVNINGMLAYINGARGSSKAA
jgi:hypothetical protein